jgi:hypothetical protein
VARGGDLAHLAHLGVDVDDPALVARLATRCARDLGSGRTVVGAVDAATRTPVRPRDLWTLVSQRPEALVPIGRLEAALAAQARAAGATLVYGQEVVRLRRHAREVSLVTTDGTTARAALAIVATGARRALIDSITRGATAPAPTRTLVAGVLATGGDVARWVRAEVPTGSSRLRVTLLETPAASGFGTALLVDPQRDGATDADLIGDFEHAARTLGIEGAYRAAPRVFTTGATAIARRYAAGDGRAPVIAAGDAAQTGHVFSGQTCFVNLALALDLASELTAAHTAVRARAVGAPALLKALAKHANRADMGAALLATASRRHETAQPPGAWALASIN